MVSTDESSLSTLDAEGLIVSVLSKRQVYEYLTAALSTCNHFFSFYRNDPPFSGRVVVLASDSVGVSNGVQRLVLHTVNTNYTNRC